MMQFELQNVQCFVLDRGFLKREHDLYTAIQISVRAAIVYVFVPRIGLRGAAIGCAVGWCCMLVNCAFQYRKVHRKYEAE